MSNFVSATYHPDILTVEYTDENGDLLLRSGGTIAWRLNNPGNLRPGSKYKLHIGKGKTKSGEFLIFPTAEAGRIEKKELLLRKYKNDSISKMMDQYAPPNENDTEKYVTYITSKSGLSKDTVVGKLQEKELHSLMESMEQYEGFNAQADTRKEKWVKTTKITLSDGARPIAHQETIIKQGGNETKYKTNDYGQLPAIPHLTPNEQVELWILNVMNKLEKIDSFILGKSSQNFTYFTDFISTQATTQAHISLVAQEKMKAEPYSYVIQPGDTLGKIAKKFKTNTNKIQKDNHIREPNKILPGQRIWVSSSSPTPNSQPIAKTQNNSINIATTPARSKEGQGQPLAVIPSNQKRAPWMEVAIREATQWADKKETIITKTDNYHHEVGLSGDLESTPWCASFVNYCLMASNTPYERSASSQFAAHSKKFTKIPSPIYGSIIIWQKGGKGHVAFVYGKDSVSMKTIALGGNQNDRITFMLETDTTKQLVGYYIPNTYFEFYKKEGALPEYDIINLNKIIGNTTYSRKQHTKDR